MFGNCSQKKRLMYRERGNKAMKWPYQAVLVGVRVECYFIENQ